MRIVVLDGYTNNPGDLSWQALEALGDCRIHDRTPPEQLLDRAGGAEIVLTNKVPLTAETIDALDALRYVGVLATGYNIVDVDAARRRGIVVTNVPAYGTESVAQMVFAHLLNLTQHVADHAAGTCRGRWSESPDFCYWDWPLIELKGLTIGLVGLGRIGRAVAAIARAFGMDVLGCDPRPDAGGEGIELVGIDELFRRSDVVSLHCPLTDETAGLADARRLGLMKPSAFLINTARGGLIDEPALVEGLQAGRLAAAALDVLSVEPPPPDHPLLSVRNCVVTPHIAWATRSARRRLLDIAVGNVRAFLEGQPRNFVS